MKSKEIVRRAIEFDTPSRLPFFLGDQSSNVQKFIPDIPNDVCNCWEMDRQKKGWFFDNPVEDDWGCKGMEREGLKCDFGNKLIFHGGVDNQYTLPFGSVAEVRQEVIDNFKMLGEGGGYILAPCHNIQVISPPENIVAMYETGYRYGTL